MLPAAVVVLAVVVFQPPSSATPPFLPPPTAFILQLRVHSRLAREHATLFSHSSTLASKSAGWKI